MNKGIYKKIIVRINFQGYVQELDFQGDKSKSHCAA